MIRSGLRLAPVAFATALAVACGPTPGSVDGGPWWAPALELDADAVRPRRLAPPPAQPLREVAGKLESELEPCPLAYFRRRAGRSEWAWPEHPLGRIARTFAPLGVRRAAPLPDRPPDPLLVLTGDSHIDGVVDDGEVVSAVLEERLRERGWQDAVVLNAACGYYTFPNYLGVVTRFTRLAPDWVVVVVYGGNDFGALLPMQAELEGRAGPARAPGHFERLAAAGARRFGDRDGGPSLWQGFNQLAALAGDERQQREAVELALDYTRAMAELCEQAGSRLLVVYLPPAHDVRQESLAAIHGVVAQELELDADALGTTQRLADRYLEGVALLGVDHLDLRADLQSAERPSYWVRDEHLNAEGHRILADRLARRLFER